MAALIRHVDTGTAAGGDDVTLADGTQLYQSLNAAEADLQQDLTDDGGDTMDIRCSRIEGGGEDTATLVT